MNIFLRKIIEYAVHVMASATLFQVLGDGMRYVSREGFGKEVYLFAIYWAFFYGVFLYAPISIFGEIFLKKNNRFSRVALWISPVTFLVVSLAMIIFSARSWPWEFWLMWLGMLAASCLVHLLLGRDGTAVR